MTEKAVTQTGTMQLTPVERDMLKGVYGEATKNAIEFQIKVGNFFEAERFVEINNAHVMGDIEVMGDAGFDLLKSMSSSGARCVVPTTSNARCMHFDRCESLKPDCQEQKKEEEIIFHLNKIGVSTIDTCINYQTAYQASFGEHLAWGDTGTVIYANSVFGARANYEGGVSSFAAALTGRTPAYGFHLDRHRKGTILVDIQCDLADLADWGAVGKIVGHPHQNYLDVPVFINIKSAVASDALKHLGASLASYGSMAMFHIVGITPEAKSVEMAFGGGTPSRQMIIRQSDLNQVYESYHFKPGRSIVVFSGPQQSLFEIENLAKLFAHRAVAKNTSVFVTTNHAVYADAVRCGYIELLESAGVTVLKGVCFYLLQRLTEIRKENEWVNLVSNSAKIVNTITAHRFNTVLRKTSDCIEIACGGTVK